MEVTVLDRVGKPGPNAPVIAKGLEVFRRFRQVAESLAEEESGEIVEKESAPTELLPVLPISAPRPD